MEKKCFKCGKIKSLDEFYKHPKMHDGRLGKCKKCTKRDVSERYNSPEGRKKVRAYEQKRFQDPKRKQAVAEYQRNRRKSKPGRARATYMVNYAIRKGRILRLPCEVCGEPKSQAHHDDYRKPLSVRWMCFKHHREIAHGQKVG